MGLTFETDVVTGEQLTYTGRELTSHWIYRRYAKQRRLASDAAVAFVGPCELDLGEMVDLEDVVNEAPIYSPLMLHIIAEFFDSDLHQTVYRQRMLIVVAKELLERKTEWLIKRSGDDIFVIRPDGSRGKLSVSIATASPTSTLIHTGFNILTEGTPVPTAGLAELGVEPLGFASDLLAGYRKEIEDIYLAKCKVRAVA